ncbi:unnamed protein product [Rotaria sordida]|nr:unnamed protein product [Rotaria sordida]
MTKLTEIKKNCSNETIRKAARGILWNLNSDRDKQIFTEKCDSTTFDIMISYSHKDKQICKHLYEQLIRTGYRVWIDFDQIHGNVMDAMVQAIEQSRTIIICMSEQYRRSNYCRAEAEYAFQRRLKIVPVLLQEHYKPDGWLLFLIGQSLYVDFTKHEFPIAIEMLIKEIKALHMQDLHNIEVQSNQSALLALPPSVPRLQPLSGAELRPENVQNWTTAQVGDWLKDNNLLELAQLLSDVDGQTLIYFSEYITRGDTQHILASLQQDSLRLINRNVSVIELARFRNLIKQHGLASSTSVKSMNKINVQYRKWWKSLNQCHMM